MNPKLILPVIAVSIFLVSCAPVKQSAKEEPKEAIIQTELVPKVIEEQKSAAEIPPQISCKDNKICLLAPLTGEYGEYGIKIRNGALCAIDRFNSEYQSSYKLIEFDTIGNLEETITGINSISSDPKALAIIGPVLNKNITEFIKTVNEKGIPAVTPTVTFLEKAPDNSYFFKSAVSPVDEGRTAAEFAVSKLNKTKFAVIHSTNSYSKKCAEAFTETILKNGREIVKDEEYPEGAYDFKAQMIPLGGIDPHIIKDMIEGDKQNMESMTAKLVSCVKYLTARDKKISKAIILKFNNIGKNESTLKDDNNYGDIFAKKLSYGLAKLKEIEVVEMAEVYDYMAKAGSGRGGVLKAFDADIFITGSITEVSPFNFRIELKIFSKDTGNETGLSFEYSAADTPIKNPLGIEAVYIPAEAAEAENIISNLAFFDLRTVCIGNSKWIDEKIIKNGKSDFEGAYLSTMFYENSKQEDSAAFSDEYKMRFSDVPDDIASLGFDAASVLLEAFKLGACSREDVKNHIADIKGLKTLNGRIDFIDGELRRNLNICTIKDGEVVGVDEKTEDGGQKTEDRGR